jgi:LmbE family N-acetylglucosaminyl deacetylase
MKNIILVIAPHADDEVIGCGATMAKHIRNSDDVYVIIATNASEGAPELFTQKQIELVRKEALKAHEFLGVKKTYFLEFPAPALNAFPEYKISLELSSLLEKIKPNIIYIPHPGDIHQDHKAIYRSSLVAARPQGNYSIKEIYCYETLSETDWTPIQEKSFVPNIFVDVTEVFDFKIKAMTCFQSQLKSFPHPRSLEAFESLAKYRGATIGVERAESFVLERIIR